MRALALVVTPIALAVCGPAYGQSHGPEHEQQPPATTAPANPHANHDMSRDSEAPQAAPPQQGLEHAAELYYDPAVMARAREQLLLENGGMRTTAVFIDRLETRFSDDHVTFAWEAQGWYGGDIHRFWWKSEGEGEFGEDFEYADAQLLYSRAVTPYFDIQAGLRQSYRPAGDRTDIVVGVQGLAPYWFEVSAEAFLSTEGELTARAEAEYDLRLTQRLALQPSAEINLSADDIPEFAIASGFTGVELGARLRYEIRRDFAPYVGVEWESALGETRTLIEDDGEDPDATRFVVGLHFFL